MSMYLFRCCGLLADIPAAVSAGAPTMELPHLCTGGIDAIGLADLQSDPAANSTVVATTEAELPSGQVTPYGSNQ